MELGAFSILYDLIRRLSLMRHVSIISLKIKRKIETRKRKRPPTFVSGPSLGRKRPRRAAGHRRAIPRCNNMPMVSGKGKKAVPLF
jgi:hypothetical protein